MSGPVTIVSVTKTSLDMGACGYFDYAHDSPVFGDRITRCYELAGRTLTLSIPNLPESVPSPVRLIHGVWSSPETRDRPIAHAWVETEDDKIWEPITAMLHHREKFYVYTHAIVERSYTAAEATSSMLASGHYGPWH